MTIADVSKRANPVTTPHGNHVYWYYEHMADACAKQAARDAAKVSMSPAALRTRGQPGDPAIIPLLAALTIASADFINLGVTLARNAQQGAARQFFEASFVNYSSTPVVVYNYHCSTSSVMTRMPGLLGSGDADSAVLLPSTSNTTPGFASDTFLRVDFLVGAIHCWVRFDYSAGDTPVLWQWKLHIDGAEHKFSQERAIAGMYFTPGSTAPPGTPSFSIYGMPVQGTSAEFDFSIYSYVAPAA
jgi:hypothetical protein